MGNGVKRQFLWIPFVLLGALVAIFAVGGVAFADEEYDVELPDTMVKLNADGKEVEGNVPNFKARVTGAGGYYGSCIKLSFENNTSQPIRVKVPIGLRLVPRNGSVQTMYTAGGEVITVLPGSSEATIKAFCGEMHDSAPGTSDAFDAGGFADDELMQTLKNINKNQAYDYDGQQAVWNRTDDNDISDNEAAQKLVTGGAVSGKKAAAAGGAAGGVAGTGAVLERRRKINGKGELDEEPSEGPEPDSDTEGKAEKGPEADSSAATKTEKGPEGGAEDRPDKNNIPPGYSGYTKTGELVIDGKLHKPEPSKSEGDRDWDKEIEELFGGGEDKDKKPGAEGAEGKGEGKADGKRDAEPGEETKGDKGDEAETKKDKAKTLTDGYVRVRTVGKIEILRHPETKKYAVSDGKFMGGKGDDGYWLTRDGKVVICNPETGKVEVTDGRYTVEREGTTYTVTKDNKLVSFNEKNGEFKVTDGHYTVKKDDNVYTATKDNKLVSFNEKSGDFKVSDAHYTVESKDKVVTFTKDKLKLTYDRNQKTGTISRWGSKYGVNVTAGQKGQWGVGAQYKGSVDGTPTTFKLSADKYQLPGTGGTGFKARADMIQKNFGVTTQFAKDNQGKTWNVGVNIKQWNLNYGETPQGDKFGVTYKKFFFLKEGDKRLYGYQKKF